MQDCRERAGLEGEHRRLIDAIPGLIWAARPDGSIDFLNGRWCRTPEFALRTAMAAGGKA